MDVNPFASLIDTEALEWIPTGGGNSLKILRVSEETGSWSALINAKAGTVNPRHRHLGPADFLVLSGSIEYRGGFAKAGSWVYEPAGAIHDATSHSEDTIYLANVHGPIAYLNDEGGVISVSDGESMRALGRKAGVLI
jgi:anti-sigma factor ChrR (cupin superfamily)